MNEPTELSRASNDVLAAIDSIPRHHDGPVFGAPWEAEVFALTLSLHQQGIFTWKEWASELSSQIGAAQLLGDPDLGDTYYHHWLAALEAMIVQKQLGDKAQLSQLYDAWDHAAKTTPHGQPIVLDHGASLRGGIPHPQ